MTARREQGDLRLSRRALAVGYYFDQLDTLEQDAVAIIVQGLAVERAERAELPTVKPPSQSTKRSRDPRHGRPRRRGKA